MLRTIQTIRYAQVLQQEYGIEPEMLLTNTGVNFAELQNPDTLISLQQYSSVIKNMYRLSSDPGIAFTVSGSIKLSDLGVVGYAMISAKTLQEATDIWGKYSNSLVGQYVKTSWDRSGNEYSISFTSPTNTGLLHQFETEQAIVRGRFVVHDLTGSYPVFKHIALSYPQPPHVSLYEEVMQCPLTFNAPKTTVHISSPSIDTPVRTSDAELFQLCADNCNKVMRLMPNSSSLFNQLRDLFLSNPGQLPTLNEASKMLSISPSTMLRKLESSGYSYQSIKDEFRFELAREYLHSGHLAAKQIAYLLGFSSTSNFQRAFKNWSGLTVSDFLQKM
jgi:AraC-like DNA-binding protein